MTTVREAEKLVHDIYRKEEQLTVIEAMGIINKYTTVTGQTLMECSIDEVQADSVKLVALNFHIGTITSDLEYRARQAYNVRKYQFAKNWVKFKEELPKATQGYIDNQSEVMVQIYRQDEAARERQAKIMRQAHDSIIETVNILKKVVEKLLVQGQFMGTEK